MVLYITSIENIAKYKKCTRATYFFLKRDFQASTCFKKASVYFLNSSFIYKHIRSLNNFAYWMPGMTSSSCLLESYPTFREHLRWHFFRKGFVFFTPSTQQAPAACQALRIQSVSPLPFFVLLRSLIPSILVPTSGFWTPSGGTMSYLPL